jgi:hypothetical protein
MRNSKRPPRNERNGSLANLKIPRTLIPIPWLSDVFHHCNADPP